MRVDVLPVRRGFLELLPDLPHEDVDRTVTVRHSVAPDLLVDLFARKDLPGRTREQSQQLELAPGQIEALVPDVNLEASQVDLELADHRCRSHEPRCRSARTTQDRLDPRRNLVGMAWLRDPVIRAQMQRANAVAYRADRGDDNQRELRRLAPDLFDVSERVGPKLGRVEHDCTEAVAQQLARRQRRRVDDRMPAKPLHAVCQHLHERGIRIHDRDARADDLALEYSLCDAPLD